MSSKIFVNLPVKDLQRSMAFFKALGFDGVQLHDDDVVPGLEAKLQRLNDTPGSQLRLGGLTFFRDLAVASEILVGESASAVEPIIANAYRTSLSERRKSFIQQNGWSASCYTDPASSTMRTLCSVGRIPPG